MDIRERLFEIRSTVSPRRINEAIHPTGADANKIFEILPDEIKNRFETESGKPKMENLNRFLNGLTDLLEEGYSVSQIVQMDSECIDNKGRIKKDRLKSILNGRYDD